MTPADHAALSAQLALALGWRIVDVVEVTDYEQVHVGWDCVVYLPNGMPKRFDYRDPSVALPVLEWLMREHGCRPMPWGNNLSIVGCTGNVIAETDTLHEAIARAAIAVADEKRQRVEQNEAREVLQP